MMQTKIAHEWQSDPEVQEAEQIVRQCVHCGLCNATCPTYQLLGDERDGPRGRIYLIKQVLEGERVTHKTQMHLDRCLTCRACESTCPSGVHYARLLEIGRGLVEQKVARSWLQKWWRAFLVQSVTRPQLLKAVIASARALRPFLPSHLQEKILTKSHTPELLKSSVPSTTHAKKVLLLEGCVPSQLAPNIHAATIRVLDRLETQCVVAPQAGCCGAVHQHMGDDAGAKQAARKNIDAWWPMINPDGDQSLSVEAIVMTSSACGLSVKEYGQLLAHDAMYAEKAKRVSAMSCDVSQWVLAHRAKCIALLGGVITQSVVWHAPCSLQHGLKLGGHVEELLASLGVEVRRCRDSHLCCGSAGLYSILQPTIAEQLRDQKVHALTESGADLILSANMACQQFMQVKSTTPILHWIEFFDQMLSGLPAVTVEVEPKEEEEKEGAIVPTELAALANLEQLATLSNEASAVEQEPQKAVKKTRQRAAKKVSLPPEVQMNAVDADQAAVPASPQDEPKRPRKPRVNKLAAEAELAPAAKPKKPRKPRTSSSE